MKQADLENMLKKASQSDYTSTIVSPDPLSLMPTSSVRKTRKHRRGPGGPEPVDADIQMEYFSD
jgi:hypothetical protein